jgi:hypothetical protein
MKQVKLALAAGVAVALAFSAVADTTYTNYGDFAGADVEFIQVTEQTTNPGDTVPKYGAPLVSGNSMDFNPVGFSAIAANGSSDITDGNLVFTVDANQENDFYIEAIGFAERGNFLLGGAGTDATYVDVDAYFVVEIKEINYSPVDPILIDAWMNFSPNTDGTRQLVTDGAGGGIWSGSVLIDINAYLATNNIPGFATRVDVDLNNVLSAYSEDGTSSLIAKKDFDSALTVDIIPEPASLVLVLGATSLIAFVRRRFIG